MKRSTDRDDGVGRPEGRGLVSDSGGGECPGLSDAGRVPDPEVAPRAKRRRFSAAYKARIVEEADGCSERGAVGALLRREGLYSSQLTTWRKQYRAAGLDGLRDDKRGRKAATHPLDDEVTRLRRENARLSSRLEQAEAIIEIQKKVSAMLGSPLNSIEREEQR
jgi:transposase